MNQPIEQPGLVEFHVSHLLAMGARRFMDVVAHDTSVVVDDRRSGGRWDYAKFFLSGGEYAGLRDGIVPHVVTNAADSLIARINDHGGPIKFVLLRSEPLPRSPQEVIVGPSVMLRITATQTRRGCEWMFDTRWIPE